MSGEAVRRIPLPGRGQRLTPEERARRLDRLAELDRVGGGGRVGVVLEFVRREEERDDG
jgi:hypothetical protein